MVEIVGPAGGPEEGVPVEGDVCAGGEPGGDVGAGGDGGGEGAGEVAGGVGLGPGAVRVGLGLTGTGMAVLDGDGGTGLPGGGVDGDGVGVGSVDGGVCRLGVGDGLAGGLSSSSSGGTASTTRVAPKKFDHQMSCTLTTSPVRGACTIRPLPT